MTATTAAQSLSQPITDHPIFGIVGKNPFIECPQVYSVINHSVLVGAKDNGLILYLNEDHPDVAPLQDRYFTYDVGGILTLTDAKLRFQHAMLANEARLRFFSSWVAVSCKYEVERQRLRLNRVWMGDEADAVSYSMQYTISKEKAKR